MIQKVASCLVLLQKFHDDCLQLENLVCTLTSKEYVRSPVMLLVPPQRSALPVWQLRARVRTVTSVGATLKSWHWSACFSFWATLPGEFLPTAIKMRPHNGLSVMGESFSGILEIPSYFLSSLLLGNLAALKMFFCPFVCITGLSFPPHKLQVSCCPDPSTTAAVLVSFSSTPCRIFHLGPAPVVHQHIQYILRGYTCIW